MACKQPLPTARRLAIAERKWSVSFYDYCDYYFYYCCYEYYHYYHYYYYY